MPTEVIPAVPLRPDEARRLKLSPHSYFDRFALAEHVATWPHLAWYADGEYAVGGYWRGRRDIGLIVETAAPRHRRALLSPLLQRFQEEGCGAVVLGDYEANHSLAWYLAEGWGVLEETVGFELRDCRRAPEVPPTLEVLPFQPQAVVQILEVERASFPWLWWKSEPEFLQYASDSGVKVFTGHQEGQVIGYVGFTRLGSYAHLDRLAIRDRFQGQGYGAQLLSFALRRLSALGARAVTLTTQRDNLHSQSLYRRFGFSPSGQGYLIYGQWFQQRV